MKKKNKFIINTTVPEQTPDMLLETKKPDELYEKAFLSREEKSKSEFCQNTTCSD